MTSRGYIGFTRCSSAAEGGRQVPRESIMLNVESTQKGASSGEGLADRGDEGRRIFCQEAKALIRALLGTLDTSVHSKRTTIHCPINCSGRVAPRVECCHPSPALGAICNSPCDGRLGLQRLRGHITGEDWNRWIYY